jgi:hypothetical protein
VRSKWFLRLWYVWCKLWIYLAPTLTLSPNVPKQDSTWPTSLSNLIRCVQIHFRAYRSFGTNHAPILNQDWHLSPNGPKRDSTWPTSPKSSIGCVQNDLWAYSTFSTNCAPILNQDWHNLQTNQNELPVEPRHLGVSSSVSKMISEPMVRLAQTVHLSCTETNTVSKQTETSFHLSLVTQEYHSVLPK